MKTKLGGLLERDDRQVTSAAIVRHLKMEFDAGRSPDRRLRCRAGRGPRPLRPRLKPRSLAFRGTAEIDLVRRLAGEGIMRKIHGSDVFGEHADFSG